jgi:hypothetical protein
MFKSRILPIATLLLGLALLITSFDWSDKPKESQSETNSSDAPSALATNSNAPTSASVLDVPVVTLSSKPVLHIGDIFPLLKTVEQRVTQQRAGKQVTTTSRLTAKLMIEVVDIVSDDVEKAAAANRTPGDLLLSIRYESVKFTQDIPGLEVAYDSDRSTASVPAAARPYDALVGQGFQFWLQRGGEVRELAGFQDFMQACLRDVSAEQRTEAWKSMAKTSPRDQIANFIDESVGLLPTGPLQLNNSWQRTQQVSHPVPIELSMQYTLREIGADQAVVSIGGTVQPGDVSPVGAVRIEIRGGRVTGQATIDRRSGLPVSSQIDQEIQMAVQVPGEAAFEQIKQTRSRITSLYQDTTQQSLPLAGASGARTSTR